MKEWPSCYADVMDGADVGMIQGGSGPRLALESAQRFPVASQIVRQELEGDEATEPCVLRFVDHAHSAAAELRDDAVVGEGLADQGVSALWRVVGVVVDRCGCRFRGRLDDCRIVLPRADRSAHNSRHDADEVDTRIGFHGENRIVLLAAAKIHTAASLQILAERHRSKFTAFLVSRVWCGRGDPNPYGIATASPSTWFVLCSPPQRSED